jgi:hypothetical protein
MIMLLAVAGCNRPVSIEGFDSGSWKSDQNGCNEDRLKQYKVLLNNQDDLLGLNSKQIIKKLGMPERNELYQRNQKFFIYNITPAPVCDLEYDKKALFLFIRFNAVGLSQEVFVQDQPNFRSQSSSFKAK